MIGFTNKIVQQFYEAILKDERLRKLLYYRKELENKSIDEVPDIKNPVKLLKEKVFRNRRIETLQKESEICITISLYQNDSPREMGKRYDYNLRYIIEVGVLGHKDIDDIIDGSRIYAIADILTAMFIRDDVTKDIGQITYLGALKARDLIPEYNGYLLHFQVFNPREAL